MAESEVDKSWWYDEIKNDEIKRREELLNKSLNVCVCLWNLLSKYVPPNTINILLHLFFFL